LLALEPCRDLVGDPVPGDFELRRLRSEGRTLVVTTQYVTEAEYCDRIAIMDNGRIIALDTPAALKAPPQIRIVEGRMFNTGTLMGPEQATLRGGYSVAYERQGLLVFTGVYGANPGSTLSLTRSEGNGLLMGASLFVVLHAFASGGAAVTVMARRRPHRPGRPTGTDHN